jgi:hypothetical protein
MRLFRRGRWYLPEPGTPMVAEITWQGRRYWVRKAESMPRGIESWRRRENSGSFVGSRLREVRRPTLLSPLCDEPTLVKGRTLVQRSAVRRG